MLYIENIIFLVDSVIIPECCSCVINIYAIHRDTNLWKYPDDFYPEHFLPQEIKKRHNFAFLPFSGGLRSCLGNEYLPYLLIN